MKGIEGSDWLDADGMVHDALASGAAELALNWLGITALPPLLAELAELRRLSLKDCRRLRELGPLAALAGLEELVLRRCEGLVDINGLAGLTGLRRLDLSCCNSLKDAGALSGLTGLRHLDLSRCPLLESLPPLGALRELETLSTSVPLRCAAGHSVVDQLPQLRALGATNLEDAPQELAHSLDDWDEGEACLARIRAWQADLASSGAAPNTEMKLFVLGNGGVGKTQIARRLQGLGFDPEVPSTHGIMLGRFPLLAGRGPQQEIFANLWDFGGQDVYLGTHSLFLDERAVYLIVWSPEQENDKVYEENGVPMRNRPLSYWLEYVRSLVGSKAPVVVAQSKCDSEEDVREAPLRPDHGFARLQRTACSALDDDGLDRLLPELRAAAKWLVTRHAHVVLPHSWTGVARRLRQLRDGGQRTLAWDAFAALCGEMNAHAPPLLVICFLHGSGQVFWRDGVFGNQVVLDQGWALEGMYAVLHRSTSLPLIRRYGGMFSRELLAALVWQPYTEPEQSLFLSMMQQCGTCFEVEPNQFIAPELLPPAASVQQQVGAVWRDAEVVASVGLEYDFLHEGIVREVLCKVGKQAGAQGVYWCEGVCFYDGEAKAPVKIWAEFDPECEMGQRGSIFVEAAGRAAVRVVQHLVWSIKRIRFGPPPREHWRSGAPDAVPLHVGRRRADVGTPIFSGIHPAPVPVNATESPKVHVSYAWGGSSEQLVDDLERRLAQSGYQVWRDKSAMRNGDWISRFMREVGQAKCVLVVLSAKYIKSVYCMRELLYIHQTCMLDANEMRSRVVPLVMDDAGIATPLERMAVVRYWQDQHARLEEATRGINPLAWGDTTRDHMLLIPDFVNRAADMLAWCVDVLMPREAAIRADNFALVLDLVRQRAG